MRTRGDSYGWQILDLQVLQDRRGLAFNSSANFLERLTKPAGTHLMERAGNFRNAQFGLMSVVDWMGVPMVQVLESVRVAPGGTRVLVSGFDRYTPESANSIPGASWIFAQEELKSTDAFLATQMNGEPLTKTSSDHSRTSGLVPGLALTTDVVKVNSLRIRNQFEGLN